MRLIGKTRVDFRISPRGLSGMKLMMTAAAGIVSLSVVACSSGQSTSSGSTSSGTTSSGTTASSGTTSIVLTRSLASVANIAPDVAQLNGYFKAQRLSVKIFTTAGGQTAAAALFSGSAQFSLDSANNMISADGEGHSLMAVAAAQNQQALPTVVSNQLWDSDNLANASIKQRILALRGKRLGVVSLHGANVGMFDAMLNYVGLTPESAHVQYIALGSSTAIVAAFKAGRIDAFNVSPPQPQQMEAQNRGHIIVDPTTGAIPSVNGSLSNVFQADKDYLASHQDVAQRFVNAIAMAERYLTLHPDETAVKLKNAGQFPTIDLPTLKSTIKELVKNEGIAPGPVISPSGFQKTVALLNLTSSTPSDVQAASVVDNTFAKIAASKAKEAVS